MRFFRQFEHLLPNAEAWRVTIDKYLRQLFLGLAENTSDAVEFVDLAYLDLFPETTRNLAEWEAEFALPGNGTEGTRRTLLAGRWQAQGGQSPAYLQGVMQAAGFPVYIYEWWDDDDGAYSGESLDITGLGGTDGLRFAPDGASLMTVSGSAVQRFTLSSSFALETGTADGDLDTSSEETTATGVVMSLDGTVAFVSGQSGGGDVYRYDLATPYDVTSGVYSGLSFSTAAQTASPTGLDVSDDGLTLIVADPGADDVHAYTLATAWDLTSVVFDQTADLSVLASDGVDVRFASGGQELYVLRQGATEVVRLSMTTPYDIGTLGATGVAFDTSGEDAFPTALDVVARSVYVTGGVATDVFKYDIVRTAKDPNTYTNSALFGSTQAGDDGSISGVIAECGEQPPDQKSTASAICNRFLVNDVGYLVNLDLTQNAPPGIPNDPDTYPYFLYWASSTFPTPADIPADEREDFERLLLQLNPTQQWLVTLVNYTMAMGIGFAYSFAGSLPLDP